MIERKFTTKTDVINDIITAIEAGGAATGDEFDLEAIADEAFTFDGTHYIETADADEFWVIVQRHAIAEQA